MAEADTVVDLSSVQISCRNCCLTEICLPVGLSSGELEELISIINRSPSIPRGEHIFSIGDPIKSLYAVRSGSVKVYVPTETGEEQVHAFALPGEIVGFDAIEDDHHTCAAVTLETTTLCELPYDRLEEICHAHQALDHELHRMFGKEISNEHALLQLLGKKSAEERLAAFLIGLSKRFKTRGFSERQFNLSMSRHDISNYLGLAVETVSRLFARFQDEGILSVDRRYVEIHDLDRLRDILGECPMDESCPQFQR